MIAPSAPEQTPVLIVGAGPTGLALAADLTRRGVEVLVVDRQAAGANTSRAAVVHARTLEVLEPLGVVPDLLASGLHVRTFVMRDRDAVLARIELAGLPTAYDFALMCPQDRTEAILLRRFQSLGGEVRRPCTVQAIRPSADGVDVDLSRGPGAVRTVRAQWLVGCDGGHSLVREAAGIGFAGGTYEDSFVLADVRMDWPLGRAEITLFLAPEGLLVVVPLPDDRFRVVATVAEAPAEPDAALVQALLDARGPERLRSHIRDVVWSSRFRVHHRLAEEFRRGRVLLCGDAAHVHSPAGGQGMNTGIQDAMALAAVLPGVLAGALAGGDEGALDRWARVRRRRAGQVVTMTDRMTRAGTLTSRPARILRNLALSTMGRVPAVRRALASTLAELER